MTDDEETRKVQAIQEKREKASLWEKVCFQNHQNPHPRRDPHQAYHNAMLGYYRELRHYLKHIDGVEHYWNPSAVEEDDDAPDPPELPGELDGLKDLDDWRFKQRTYTTREFDPNHGTKTVTKFQSTYLQPDVVSEVLDVLDEVALKLGFTPDADQPTPDTELTADVIDEAKEHIEEKR